MIQHVNGFATEELLRTELINQINEPWWNRRTFDYRVAKPESTCHDGRADLVWGGFQFRYERWTVEECELLQHPTAAAVVQRLAESRKGLTELVKSFRLGSAYVRSIIRRLQEVELVVEHGGYLRLRANFEIPEHEIWAYECKLADWRRVLIQASRHSAFAHRVFVVMPERFVHRMPADRIKNNSLGLVAFHPQERGRILFRGRHRIPWLPAIAIRAIAWLLA